MKTIIVMVKRQIKLFYRSKPRILGSIAQPTLFLLAMGLGFSPVFEQTGQLDYIQYLTPGIIGMSLLFGSMMNGASVIWDKKFGFLKETLVAPVPRSSLLIGRCLGGSLTSMLQGIIVLVLSMLLLGFTLPHPAIILLFLPAMLLVALPFNLLGTVIAARIDDMQAFPTIMNFMILPMFFLSGALFPIENLPPFVITITRFNPMTYSVNLLRGIIWADYSPAIFLNVGVLGVMLAILLSIGSYMFDRIQT